MSTSCEHSARSNRGVDDEATPTDDATKVESSQIDSSARLSIRPEKVDDVNLGISSVAGLGNESNVALVATEEASQNTLRSAARDAATRGGDGVGGTPVTPDQTPLQSAVSTPVTQSFDDTDDPLAHSMTSPFLEPHTTLSLDQEEAVSDLEKSPPSDTELAAKHRLLVLQQHSQKNDDKMSARADPDLPANADDSSDDDSSYFADPSHLPKPKSGRRYSWSSNASPTPTDTHEPHVASSSPCRDQQPQLEHVKTTSCSVARESDASLSLSDDTDDEPHPKARIKLSRVFAPQPFPSRAGDGCAPLQQQQNVYAQHLPTPQFPHQNIIYQQQHATQQQSILYQQQQQQTHQFVMPPRGGVPELYSQQLMPRMHSVSSLVSTSSQNSSASDASLQDELRNVALHSKRANSNIPSGRQVPILGEHPPSRIGGTPLGLVFGSPSTVNFGPSPPTILQSYSGDGHITHPQPHSMTAEQLATWAELAAASHTPMAMEDQQTRGRIPSTASAYSRESDLAYSGDSDAQPRTPRGFQETNQDKRKSQRDGKQRTPLLPPRDDSIGQREVSHRSADERGFTVYWQRWLMLMYMSILNLLSDWTCYSVAPIALLTEEAFGQINAEQLVVVFLCANGVATACEPIILSRLGLRRTVLFGALLLMIGSIVKSGGMPPIIQADLKKGEGEWRVYLGFFLVGLSQPLYQCTPALLSASWFPQAERTLATSVALNANQLGIGFAFIFGTLLVKTSDDIPKYFGLLSVISTLTFLGTLVQFDDAPPTPPSDTARVMRGTLEVNVPSVEDIFKTVRLIGSSRPFNDKHRASQNEKRSSGKDAGMEGSKELRLDENEVRRSQRKSARKSSRQSSEKNVSRRENATITRRRVCRKANGDNDEIGFHGLAPSPSPARWEAVAEDQKEHTLGTAGSFSAPVAGGGDISPAVPDVDDETMQHKNLNPYFPQQPYYMMPYPGQPGPFNPYVMHPSQQHSPYQQSPYWDPQYASQLAYFQHQQQQQQAQMFYQQMGYHPPPVDPYYSYYNSYQHGYGQPPMPFHQPISNNLLPPTEAVDEGAEPVITILPHQLDINIRDDQIWLSTRACLARPGFIHSLVSFTVSGIVINTLSTFMDYLVRLNGAGREYTGIVGGTFQFVIMISSLLIGKVCDNTRAYYSITIGMLVLGAFGLAECGVSLDANRGVSLRWSLICVALLVGPLQPVSTELGVDVVYPLSENTVLVIQQLFSNVLSAAFIPCFKAMKDFGAVATEDGGIERPAYTFSFYLLIVLHAAATVFFATFNGRYLRYEHELEKKAQEEHQTKIGRARAFHRIIPDNHTSEHAPLMPPAL